MDFDTQRIHAEINIPIEPYSNMNFPCCPWPEVTMVMVSSYLGVNWLLCEVTSGNCHDKDDDDDDDDKSS